jgi:hypothetical protein
MPNPSAVKEWSPILSKLIDMLSNMIGHVEGSDNASANQIAIRFVNKIKLVVSIFFPHQ